MAQIEVATLTPRDEDPQAFLAEIARASGVDEPGPVQVVPIDYAVGSPATGGLFRVQGTGWSAFVKVLHHLRHWPVLAFLPPEPARRMVEDFDWREELGLWQPPFATLMPAGLRPPRLDAVADLGDDRLAVWMEDVQTAPVPWDAARLERAAYLLGQLTARRSAPQVLAACPYPPGTGLRYYTDPGLVLQLRGALDNDELWADERLTGLTNVRKRLLFWRNRLPELLDALDAMPQAMPHGDACPQNLLVPVAPDAAEFVLIDCAFQSPQGIGFDLGQLLTGLVQADQAPAAGLPALWPVVVNAFVAGLAAEGLVTTVEQVSRAAAISVLIRSGFTALELADLNVEPGHWHNRVALTEWVLDLADEWCA